MDPPKDGGHQALEAIDRTLHNIMEEASEKFPELNFAVHTYPPYKDGSVTGQVDISGFDTAKFDSDDWYQFFQRMAEYESWPVAHGQASKDEGERKHGGFWFSNEMTFNVKDNRAWRDLETRYERYKGAWKTSTHWRRTREANLSIVDVALWGEGKAASIPELLQQRKYGHRVQSYALRLFWSPNGNRPNWR